MPNLRNALEIFEMEAAMPSVKMPTRPSNGGPIGITKGKPMPLPSKGLNAKQFSTKKRQKLAKKGHARPDGSYPIETTKDVSNAVKDWHRSGGSSADKAHIVKNAKRLGMNDPFKKDVSAGGPGSGRKPGMGEEANDKTSHLAAMKYHIGMMEKAAKTYDTIGENAHRDAARAHSMAAKKPSDSASSAARAMSQRANSWGSTYK